ncbi:MAG: hypothetical protein ACKVJK_02765 [Methylophagaceae bacterium]|jgi:hypothetical protein|tara:strand:+ start:678 stop:896 length:219 start_codon:yes stop_codon:yes gene_type:complete
MSEVSAISPVHTVSQYTRVIPQGSHETVTHVTHTQQEGGPVKVSEVTYTTYNARGESVNHSPPEGTNLDVMI